MWYIKLRVHKIIERDYATVASTQANDRIDSSIDNSVSNSTRHMSRHTATKKLANKYFELKKTHGAPMGRPKLELLASI